MHRLRFLVAIPVIAALSLLGVTAVQSPSASAQALATPAPSFFVNNGGDGLVPTHTAGSTLAMEPFADGKGNKITFKSCTVGMPVFCELSFGISCVTANSSGGITAAACTAANDQLWEQVDASTNAEGVQEYEYLNDQYNGQYLSGGTTVGSSLSTSAAPGAGGTWISQTQPVGVFTADDDAPPNPSDYPLTANYSIYYCGIECPFPTTIATDDWAAGTALLLKYDTTVGTGQGFCTADTNGNCTPSEIMTDPGIATDLQRIGSQASTFGHPVYMTLDWEANGGPTPSGGTCAAGGWSYWQQCFQGSPTAWTPEEYVTVTNYMIGEIMDGDTAGNITFTSDFNVGDNAIGPYLSGTGYSQSGESIMGVDGYYNSPTLNQTWTTSGLGGSQSTLQADAPSDPFWVEETGVNQADTSYVNDEIDSDTGGAAAVTQPSASCPQFGCFGAPLFYFDVDDCSTCNGIDYLLANPGSALDEFVNDIEN
jgi:hypothetical protein